MSERVYYVKAEWDADAGVWSVTQSDVPGLAAEAPSPQALIELLNTLVPEMLSLNSPDSDPDVPYSVMFDHIRTGRAVA